MNQLVPISSTRLPALAAAGESAAMCFLEFFAAGLRNQVERIVI